MRNETAVTPTWHAPPSVIIGESRDYPYQSQKVCAAIQPAISSKSMGPDNVGKGKVRTATLLHTTVPLPNVHAKRVEMEPNETIIVPGE